MSSGTCKEQETVTIDDLKASFKGGGGVSKSSALAETEQTSGNKSLKRKSENSEH